MSRIPTIAEMDKLPTEELICHEKWHNPDGRGAWYLLGLTPAGERINPPQGAMARMPFDTAFVWVESPYGAWADEMGTMNWEAKQDYARDFGISRIEKDETFTSCRLVELPSYRDR